jgi:hypothetical protein
VTRTIREQPGARIRGIVTRTSALLAEIGKEMAMRRLAFLLACVSLAAPAAAQDLRLGLVGHRHVHM